MGDITVVDWVGPDHEGETSIGGLGGWFGPLTAEPPTDTWQDYLDNCTDETRPYAVALRADIIARRKWITGEQHQNVDDGTPLFSDGTIGSFSFRAWGDLMSAISVSVDGKPRTYMNWYYIDTDIPQTPAPTAHEPGEGA